MGTIFNEKGTLLVNGGKFRPKMVHKLSKGHNYTP